MNDAKDVPIFVLCGGLGTRLKEETQVLPKPMVPVGGKPILWHIMSSYARYGFRRFVLCLGYKAEVIKSYFLNYSSLNSDFTVNLKSNEMTVHSVVHDLDWEVTLAFTGDLAMTGCRIARASARYLGASEHFGVTYGDGVCDVNLLEEFQFHLQHDKIGTVLGVNPPSRFGEIKHSENEVLEFAEKPEFKEKWINGGYFFFRRGFSDYLKDDESLVLEQAPLVNLARDHQLSLYKHAGFWACMDTQRDREYLDGLWATGKAPWKVS